MLSSERHKIIMDNLKKNGIVHSTDLIEHFGVSKETIRRDLMELEQQGFLKKVYGGAVLDKVDPSFTPFRDRKNKSVSEKQEIAMLAIRCVKEGMSIAMDVSTTNLAIAEQLKHHFHSLTILTNSLAIANELLDADGFTVILTGGILHRDEMSINGDICRETIRRFNVDLYFMSCNGVSLKAGITDFGEGEVMTKRALIDIAKKIILVCSSDRFDVISLINVCDIKKAGYIITDSALPAQVKALYEGNGVHIVNS